jgi:hypothetical protein
MKLQHLIIAVVLGLAVHRSVAESTLTNSFGIYLFANSEESDEFGSNWTSRALSPNLVLSEADILAYNFTNHLMTLTPEAAHRISTFHIRRLTEPFVVVVNGVRIYRGLFVSSSCSQSFDMSSITLWGSSQFTIYTNLPPNSLFIARTYAAPFSKVDPDPRSDDRIKQALDELHKLK